MEHSSQNPEFGLPPLSQGELSGLHYALSRLLIVRGSYEAVKGVFTPRDRPEALDFRIMVSSGLVKDIFFPGDDRLSLDRGGSVLGYMTPHANDLSEADDPESNAYLNVTGQLRGSDVTFNIQYLLTRYEPEPQVCLGTVEYEYARHGRVIDEEVVDAAGTIMSISSHGRELNREDAAGLRRLLDNLLK